MRKWQVLWLMGGALAATAQAQFGLPIGIEADAEFDAARNGTIHWQTEPGYLYKVARSVDLADTGTESLAQTALLPDFVYGFGGTASLQVVDAPPPPQTGAVDYSPTYVFFVTAFDDGTAIAAWQGDSGVQESAYLAPFDLTVAGQVQQGFASAAANDPTLFPEDFRLDAFVTTGTKNPAFTSLAPSPDGLATFARIDGQAAAILGALQSPTPAASTAGSGFGERGAPPKEFYKVYRYEYDSDVDGVPDHTELANGTSAFDIDADTDGDGIPDAWQRIDSNGDGVIDGNDAPHLLISEFSASNDALLADGDGDFEDWIEIYNPTSAAIDLGGYFLSCTSNNLARWPLPADTSIPSGGFVVVFASGKSPTAIDNGLHTDFGLNASGEDVYLVAPDGATIVDSHVSYPAQRADISAGWAPDPETGKLEKLRYFGEPTPGALNSTRAYKGWTEEPAFSVPGGVFHDTEVEVEVSSPTPGAVIYLTDNAAAPTLRSPIYQKFSPPFTLTYSGDGATSQFSLGVEYGSGDLVEAWVDGAPAAFAITGGNLIAFTTTPSAGVDNIEIRISPKATQVFDRTRVLRAMACVPGYIPSRPVTHSYLFKESVLGTASQGTVLADAQDRPPGYPETTFQTAGPPPLDAGILHDYAVDPLVVAPNKNTLLAELDAVPTVSLVVPVDDFFTLGTLGIYANTLVTTEGIPGISQPDPLGLGWERAASFEFIDPATGAYVYENCGVNINGNSSRNKVFTTKHNLRLAFRKKYSRFRDGEPDGDVSFLSPPFQTTSVLAFDQFILRQPTHNSWATSSSSLTVRRDEAGYVNDLWAHEIHAAMGGASPHLRAHMCWVHLYINGLYWGPYLLSERVDEDFMESYVDPEADYDVISDEGAEEGDTVAWDQLLLDSGNGDYAAVDAQLDLDNYIDYLIVQMFCDVQDWPTGNWRAARERDPGEKFRVLVWDAEFSFGQGRLHSDLTGSTTGIATIHGDLLSHADYQARFKSRVALHFGASGVFGVDALGEHSAAERFRTLAAEFGAIAWSESARWGDAGKTPAYGKNDPTYLPAETDFGDFDRSAAFVADEWIPDRRDIFLDDLRGRNLAD